MKGGVWRQWTALWRVGYGGNGLTYGGWGMEAMDCPMEGGVWRQWTNLWRVGYGGNGLTYGGWGMEAMD